MKRLLALTVFGFIIIMIIAFASGDIEIFKEKPWYDTLIFSNIMGVYMFGLIDCFISDYDATK